MTKDQTREQFRDAVFARDNGLCVVCGEPAVDAHHLIERRLFADGGYFPDNGVSVCGPCHIKAEQTLISPEELREAAGITKAFLPEHLYSDAKYDKWGNEIISGGQRLRGELFDDPSVQSALKAGGVLDLFTSLVKYPRTYHVPWSPGMHDDDRMSKDMSAIENADEVVVTVKMDGENSSLCRDRIHARSIESGDHPSRHWVKNLWSRIRYDIPEGWRICGENLQAKHSIGYEDLPSLFLGFSVWNDHNICLSWDETLEWAGAARAEARTSLLSRRSSTETASKISSSRCSTLRPPRGMWSGQPQSSSTGISEHTSRSGFGPDTSRPPSTGCTAVRSSTMP